MGRLPWPRNGLSEDLDLTQTACFKKPATLGRIRIADGYDSGGAYWGLPDNLWCATNGWSGDDTFQMFTRAATADAARAHFEAEAPGLIRWRKS